MRKDIVIALVAIVVVGLLAFGLSQWSGAKAPMTPSKAAGSETAGEKPSGKPVMHVNGEPVTESEFAAFMQSVPEAQRQFFANPAGRRELADEIVRIKLLEQQAKKLGLEKDPEVTSRLQMVKSQLLASRALEKLVADQVDKAVTAEYERQKGSVKTLSHILIAYEGGAAPPKSGKPLSAEQAMQKAKELVKRIRGGEDFGTVARTESDDQQSGARGGSLGPTRPDALPEDMAAVVTKLQPGQVSDPVRTQFGVQIFKVGEPTLEELRPILAQQVQQKIAMETVEKMQKGANVKLDPAFFPPVPPQAEGQGGEGRPPQRPRTNG